MSVPDLTYTAAPMVNQSDLPFRQLVERYNATTTYTQMLVPEKLEDQEYLEFHLRSLMHSEERKKPVIVQLCGNDPELIVRAGRKLQSFCDGIDLNLGCPQDHAKESHIGAYLLGQKDWPLVQRIVSSMSHSFTVPTSAKIRLCQPSSKTVELGKLLEGAGASWVTLHARTVAPNRRRKGAADLTQIKYLKEALDIPVISNGNIREYSDIVANLQFTGADGVMVGEALLDNPCLFADVVPDPIDICQEYLELCQVHPETVTFPIIVSHIKRFISHQPGPGKAWVKNFRYKIETCRTVDDLERELARIRDDRVCGTVSAGGLSSR